MKWTQVIGIAALCAGIIPYGHADHSCFPSVDCDASISGDCDELSDDYRTCGVATYFSPRSITNDLTYRNSNTFFQRFRGDASCAFFSLDSTFLYQQNRKTALLGRGYFGENPLTFAEQCAPVNSLNLGLGSKQPEGFCSTVRLSPKRKVFAWLPQLIFKLDSFCEGVWADFAFAVTMVDHRTCLFEQRVTPGDLKNEPTAVQEALNALTVFPSSHGHTGIDDIQVRIGYLMNYCEDDMISFSVLGNIPTGKQFDDAVWFQPTIGTRRGGIGGGFMFNSTLWSSEFSEEILLMGEIKYLHSFSTTQRRQFDLKNGPLSRFLLVSPQDNPDDPISGIHILRACVKVEPQHTLEWWIALHYSCACWGFEAGYNLWYRSQEELKVPDSAFNFKNRGIFDMTRCTNRTSHSTAKISDAFGEGTPDTRFVKLSVKDVNKCSAIGRKALSSTFSGTVTYASSWCDFPISFAFGARYELAAPKHHTSALENWGVFGKISLSC